MPMRPPEPRSTPWPWALLLLAASAPAQSFTDVTDAAGLGGSYRPGALDHATGIMAAGVAVADYDGDGWEDVFWPAGSLQPARLFHNDGNGGFTDVAAAAGLDLAVQTGGPLWLDIDDDGDLDLFLTTTGNTVSGTGLQLGGGGGPSVPSAGPGAQNPDPRGVEQFRDYVYLNQGDGTFVEAASMLGLERAGRWGAAFGDLLGDGACELVTATWLPSTDIHAVHVFRRRATGTWRDVTPAVIRNKTMWAFTPRVVDIDLDGDQDLLVAADIITNSFFRNDGGGLFSDVSASAHVDDVQNGMGSTVGDIDRDGDLDWFVSSIYADPPLPYPGFGSSGNRLYRNQGDGTFADGTDVAGVRDGSWGWGAQFCDLDNDGDLDLVHANGYYQTAPDLPLLAQYESDRLRVFQNDGAGVMTERAAAFGIDDPDQGRGLVVFDFDHDGALDILVANHDTGLTLYQGDPAAIRGHWLWVELRGSVSNRFGVGARVTLSTPGLPDQIELLQCGNNFLSSAPPGLWFGLGSQTSATVRVRWPGGTVSRHPVAADARVVLNEP